MKTLTKRQIKRPPSNWLPMNSAPTDGTRVLVKKPSNVEIARCVDGDWWDGREGYGFLIPCPLGWMPLPEL